MGAGEGRSFNQVRRGKMDRIWVSLSQIQMPFAATPVPSPSVLPSAVAYTYVPVTEDISISSTCRIKKERIERNAGHSKALEDGASRSSWSATPLWKYVGFARSG